MSNNIKTDILIIGGGIAGCIAATSLSKHYKVTLVDKLTTPIKRIGESLAPASQRILNQLGLLDNETDKHLIQNNVYIPNLGMQSYWGSEYVNIVDHLKNPDGFVRNLDRKAFETYLRNKTSELNITCLWGMKLYTSNYENNEWNVIVKSDTIKDRKTTEINAKFVIDASGRQSHFAKNFSNRIQEDTLVACWVSLPNTETNTMSTIVSDRLGWWYTAVIPNQRRIISFHTDPDLVDRKTFKSLASFLALIKRNKILSKYINNEKEIWFHGTVSANSTRLENVVGKQWVALGDAATSFDPLSSQGMFNAMASAIQMSSLLHTHNFIHDLNSDKIKQFATSYSYQIDNIWKHYLNHKTTFYRSETRWKNAVFWKRRQ